METMRYRRKAEYVEAVVFAGQHIPGLALSEVYRDTWEFTPPHGGQVGTARRGDYLFLRDGKPVGSAAPHFFETYYEPAQGAEDEAELRRQAAAWRRLCAIDKARQATHRGPLLPRGVMDEVNAVALGRAGR